MRFGTKASAHEDVLDRLSRYAVSKSAQGLDNFGVSPACFLSNPNDRLAKTFFHSRSFIEDMISSRIEDYTKTVKKHGINLAESAFGTFLDVRLLSSFMGAQLACIATQHLEAVLGALAGLSLYGVNVAYRTVLVKRDLNSTMQVDPIAYLHKVKTWTKC